MSGVISTGTLAYAPNDVGGFVICVLGSPQVIGAETSSDRAGHILRDGCSHEATPNWVERVLKQADRVPVGRQHKWLSVPMI